jgi:CHAT domain-containing protein
LHSPVLLRCIQAALLALGLMALLLAPAWAQTSNSGLPVSDEPRLLQAVSQAQQQHGELSAEHFNALEALQDFFYFHQHVQRWVQAQQKLLDLRIRAYGPDHLFVARAWMNLGAAHMSNRDPVAALPALQRGLAIREQRLGPEHVDVAFALTNLGGALRQLGRLDEARRALERALTMRERLLGPQHLFVSWTLSFLGQVHLDAGDPAAALRLFQRELAVRQAQPEATRHGSLNRLIAESLSNVASAQRALGDIDAAQETLEMDMRLSERNDGDAGPTLRLALNDSGLLALHRGEYAKARLMLQSSLDMARQLYGPAHRNVAHQLSSLGLLHHRVGDVAQAQALQAQALTIDEASLGPTHPQVALRQQRLAAALADLSRFAEAQVLLMRACESLTSSRPLAHPEQAQCALETARVARLAGAVKVAQDQLNRATAVLNALPGNEPVLRAALALEHAQQALAAGLAGTARTQAAHALPLALQGRSPDQEALALELLAATSESLGQAGAALFWRQQSVNHIQSLRPGASQAPLDFQRQFLASRRASYVTLAERLAAAGRVAEAQTVVAMLKEDELHEYLQHEQAADPRSTRLSSTQAAERAAEAELQRLRLRLVEQSRRQLTAHIRQRLGEAQNLASEQNDAELAWADAQADWQAWVKRLAIVLPSPAPAGAMAQPDPALRQLLKTLSRPGAAAALLHYVVTEEGLLILLSTAQHQRVLRVPLAPGQLNHDVAALRRAIQHREPVLAQAQALHRLLLAPVSPWLRRAGVRTLLLSLDGSLRYLPFGALHDGRRYLAQEHALVLFNPAAGAHVARAPSSRWSLTALGATRGDGELQPLPAVALELQRLRSGPLPAAVYQDERFTRGRLLAALEGADPVLHVASHFSFRPGALAESTLLLGDGGRMTMKELRGSGLSLSGIELLTLSACDTALGGGLDHNGAEVESFAAITQRQGAQAVLATLWPVSDGSTADFMARFYTAATAPRLPKAQALQRAQQAFIERRVRVTGSDAGEDPAHPFYWAAYVLMGNPR